MDVVELINTIQGFIAGFFYIFNIIMGVIVFSLIENKIIVIISLIILLVLNIKLYDWKFFLSTILLIGSAYATDFYWNKLEYTVGLFPSPIADNNYKIFYRSHQIFAISIIMVLTTFVWGMFSFVKKKQKNKNQINTTNKINSLQTNIKSTVEKNSSNIEKEQKQTDLNEKLKFTTQMIKETEGEYHNPKIKRR